MAGSISCFNRYCIGFFKAKRLILSTIDINGRAAQIENIGSIGRRYLGEATGP